ncbi:acetoin utilization transport system permease protein [Oceanobacillus limi]|uniref:Acetoin utilization transport system permease protein n=1 Tax=Oceanobacillus limi TaxID=930131 RepID=A0A1I0AZ31_9BACI|nr:ABC transporter permease [Oceanobacillus limi]SES99502.1 acetoin utilization transport system permease protein [Oceanobacillus limi]
MKWKDQFRFIRQNIKKNKVRTMMTILATAMGCAFLIVLASVGYGLQESVVKDTLEQQVVTEIDIYGFEEEGEYRSLTMDDIDYLESIDGVKAVTRRNQVRQIPMYMLEEYKAEAMTYVTHFPSEVEAGLKLQDGRMPEKENEVIVGSHFRNYLSVNTDDENIYDEETGEVKEEYIYPDDLVGKTINMEVRQDLEGENGTHTISLTVVGVLQEPSREWMQDQNVYISESVYNEIEEFTGTPGGELGIDPGNLETDTTDTFDEVHVYAKNLEKVQGIADKLEENNYAIYSVVNEMEQINMLFTIAKAGLILVGTIAIVIASIGIYNTMTMAVTERAPDIGIMKAIGANPKTIKQIFVLESSYIGIIGAIIGTIVAYLISVLVNIGLPFIIEMAFEDELPEGLQFSAIPPSLVFIAVGICLFVTILSGMRPAKRATQIDVLKAMRREI